MGRGLFHDLHPVFYEMHTIPQLQQCLRQETINIRVLILLYLGYIQMPNGEYLITHNIESSHGSRPLMRGASATFAHRLRILKIANGEVSIDHMRLIQELDLSITTTKILKLAGTDKILGRVLPPNLDAKMMEERGFFDVGL
jgi:hypothetical protein